MTQAQILSQPLRLPNGVVLPNRLVKSAMSEALGMLDGHPTASLETLYGRWADGGIGLSITGNVMIDRRALGEPGNVVIEDDRDLELLKQWAAAGSRHGTQLWMQINHPGKQAPRGLNIETVAPSAIPFNADMKGLFGVPRELKPDEIEEIIKCFGRTALTAKKAGFGGVQIHGAHGYLVSQFLSPHHNQRNDQWGGSPVNRRRFLLAILSEIQRQVGKEFPIGIKINSADFQRGGFSEEESIETMCALDSAGIDLVEISGGTYEAPVMTGARKLRDSTRKREAYFLEFAERARAAIRVPLMLTGGFRTAEGMANAISSGAVDLVGLARSLVIEPDLPKRILAGLPPRHEVKPISTGFKFIDKIGFMEITWYTRQIQRIGHGQEPLPDESPLMVFVLNTLRMGVNAFKMRRMRA
jgi:2,4-dienoyl-CoA reductase-like NADH-dependent reductase (Old Yellow Enzyme family)